MSTPLEWIAAAVPAAQLDPAAIAASLHDEGLVATFADTHSDGTGGLWISVPAHHDPARGIQWSSFTGAHDRTERFVRLSAFVGVTLDETEEETRLSFHVQSPISTMTVVSRAEPQRTWLRETAAAVRARILRA